ncbi:MAG: aldo/keto reductase [Candidatus Hydrogenedentes bacterium CG1_02_42_14]|nr:MAG: aldo/keto reductase [Candidatus Hydrogenedentes bacterium CG1_02_42_14]
MIRRRFGRTNIEMPVLSCGGMRFMHSWDDVPDSEIPLDTQKNLEACVLRAFELGINHFETARGYGTSERQLGKFLHRLDRKQIIVQSKGSPKENPDEFESNFRDSLKRLKLSYFDLFALHGINNDASLDWSLKPGGCLERARKLQKEGLVKHIGFSTHGPLDVIMEAVKHENNGGFDYMNLHFYYIFQKNRPAIEEAELRDMGVFIVSPSDKGGKLYEPSQTIIELTSPLHPMSFNDLFCLSEPGVHSISIGASRPSDFDLHVSALDMLGNKIIDSIKENLDNRWIEKINKDEVVEIDDGIPAWNKTPGEINIPIILWLRNLAKAYELIEYGKMRYKLLGDGGHWFPGQKAESFCEEEIIEACKRSPLAQRVPELLREAHNMFKES